MFYLPYLYVISNFHNLAARWIIIPFNRWRSWILPRINVIQNYSFLIPKYLLFHTIVIIFQLNKPNGLLLYEIFADCPLPLSLLPISWWHWASTVVTLLNLPSWATQTTNHRLFIVVSSMLSTVPEQIKIRDIELLNKCLLANSSLKHLQESHPSEVAVIASRLYKQIGNFFPWFVLI